MSTHRTVPTAKAQEEEGEEDDIGNEELEEDTPATRQMKLDCNAGSPVPKVEPNLVPVEFGKSFDLRTLAVKCLK